jgi:hypothetical protein
MTMDPVPLDALLAARDKLFRELPAGLDANERDFLRTRTLAHPDWSLLGISHLNELPAIRWRPHNLETLVWTQQDKLRALVRELDTRLA